MKEKTVARLKPRTFKARSVLTNLEEQAANANRISYKYKGEPASFFRAKLISGDGQEGCFPPWNWIIQAGVRNRFYDCSAVTARGPSTGSGFLAWPKITHYHRDCQRCTIWFKSDKNICLLPLPSADDTSKLAPSVILLEPSAVYLRG